MTRRRHIHIRPNARHSNANNSNGLVAAVASRNDKNDVPLMGMQQVVDVLYNANSANSIVPENTNKHAESTTSVMIEVFSPNILVVYQQTVKALFIISIFLICVVYKLTNILLSRASTKTIEESRLRFAETTNNKVYHPDQPANQVPGSVEFKRKSL